MTDTPDAPARWWAQEIKIDADSIRGDWSDPRGELESIHKALTQLESKFAKMHKNIKAVEALLNQLSPDEWTATDLTRYGQLRSHVTRLKRLIGHQYDAQKHEVLWDPDDEYETDVKKDETCAKYMEDAP